MPDMELELTHFGGWVSFDFPINQCHRHFESSHATPPRIAGRAKLL